MLATPCFHIETQIQQRLRKESLFSRETIGSFKILVKAEADLDPVMGLLFERGVGLDHGRGAWLGQFAIAMCPFTFLLFAIRLSYRTKVASGLGVDDYITCFAWVTLLATNILAASAIAHGYGRHAKMLTVTDLEWASRLFYAMQILYKLALYSTKTSILALYDRIFVSNTDRTFLGVPANFQTICRTTVVIMAMYTVASVSATLAQCTPFSRIFDKAISGHCINVSAFWIANGVTNILTDIWIIALPQWQVWKLKLPLRQKISLMAVFGLGVS